MKISNFIKYKQIYNCLYKKLSNIERILTKDKVNEYHKKGFTVLPNVYSRKYIEELKAEMGKEVNKANVDELKSYFDAKHQVYDRYFLESGDKIRFFMEKDAWDNEGQLRYPLINCLNKIGHAIHDLNSKFREFSYSPEVKYIAKAIGLLSPIIVQSMYILKNGRIGAEVPPHTDNTYIRTTPLSCLGIWFAFDDATKENGAMWGIPGSHRNPTNYFLKLGKDQNGKTKMYYDPPEAPKYDLSNPESIEAEQGSIVLLHGDFVHFSPPNTSTNQRHAYTLHIIDSKNHKWESDNWIQRRDIPFNFLYDADNE